jgi:hypothetical protein
MQPTGTGWNGAGGAGGNGTASNITGSPITYAGGGGGGGGGREGAGGSGGAGGGGAGGKGNADGTVGYDATAGTDGRGGGGGGASRTSNAGDGGDGVIIISYTIEPPPDNSSIEIVNGTNNQTAIAGSAISNAPQVLVKGSDGLPLVEASVTFTVETGGGSLDGSAGSATVTTDASGVATSPAWTLGTTAGANTLTASGPKGSVTFTAEGTVGAASGTQSTLVASATQATANGSTVTLTVQAQDQYGNNLTTGDDTIVISRSSGSGTVGAVTYAGNGAYTATVTAPSSVGSGTFEATINGAPVQGGTGSTQQVTITYTPGTVAKLVMTGSATQTAGTPQTITVTAQDANGNTATGYSGAKSLTFSGAASSVSPVSAPTVDDSAFGTPTSLTFTNGVATGSMVLYQAATATISVTDDTHFSSGAGNLSVTVQSATATQAVLTTSPSDGQAGIALPVQPIVQVLDPYGNLVDWDDTTVITVTASPSAAMSNATSTASNGEATFSGLSIDDSVGTYTLTFTASGLGSGDDTASVTITPGVVAVLRLSVDDTNPVTVGTTRVLTAGLFDGFGNLVTDDSASVVDFTQSGAGAVSFPPNADDSKAVTVGGGRASATLTGATSGSVNLVARVRGSSPAIDDTVTVSVVAGVPAQLDLTTLASDPADAGSAFTTQPQVTVKDAQGNIVVDDSSTVVTVSITAGPVGASLIGDGTAVATAGIASFTNLGISGPPGTYTLTFSAGGSITDDTQLVTLQVGPAAVLDDSVPAAGATYGSAFTTQPVITIDDSAGNLVTTDNTTVVTATIIDDTGTVLATATATASGGVATFSGLGDDSAVVAGTHTITYTAAGVSLVSQQITVAPASVDVTASSPSVTYGTPAPLMITPSFTGFVYSDDSSVLSTQPTCSSTYAATDSVGSTAATSCSGAVAANYTFTYNAGAVTVTQAPVTITASSATVSYGTPTPPAVTYTATGLRNGDDTSVFTTQPTCTTSGYNSTATPGTTFTTSCSGAEAVNYSFTYVSGTLSVEKADQAALTVTTTAGTFGAPLQLNASGGSGTGARTWAVVAGGSASGCAVTDDSLTSTSAGTCVVTVTQADDTNYNQAVSADTTITLAKATPTAGAWADDTRAFGSAAFALTPPQVDGVYGATNLPGTWAYASSDASVATVSDDSITITGVGMTTITGTFTPDDSVSYTTATATMTLTGIPDAPTAVQVAKSAPGEVTVSWTAPTYSPITGYEVLQSTDNATFASVSQGTCTGTVAGLSCTVTDLTAGTTYYFAVVAIATTAGVDYESERSSSSSAVTPFGVATQLVITAAPLAGASGSLLNPQPIIRVHDANGQRVLNSTVTVTVTSSIGTLTGTTEMNAFNGQVSFTDLVYSGPVNADDTLTFSSPGLSSADDTIRPTGPGPAVDIAVNTGDDQTAVAGSAVAVAPSVLVTDSVGNPVSGVSVVFTADSGEFEPSGLVATVNTDAAGIATSPTWRLAAITGVNTLTATSAGLTGSPVTFTATGVAGTAASLDLSRAAEGAASGAAFTTQPRLRLLDGNGNVLVADDTTVVSVSISRRVRR